MNDMVKDCGCGCSGCCSPNSETKKLLIDFLFLDLSTCERCMGTDENLNEAIEDVASVLKSAGYDAVINKVNITTKELALQYEFISSPTIRINGKDIALELKESTCKDCGDICGDDVDCRVWTYKGTDYNEPPKELIVNAILKEVYGGNERALVEREPYKLPTNLKVFFDGKK